MNENELIDKLILKDETAFKEFLSSYARYLYNYALKVLSNQPDAEDLTQDVVVDFLENITKFERKSSLKTYLFKILTNKICDRFKINMREKPEENIKLEILHRFSENGNWKNMYTPLKLNPEETASLNELMENIEEIIKSLPENQRMIFILKDIQGFSSKEICNILSVSQTNLRVLLHRARVVIREKLDAKL